MDKFYNATTREGKKDNNTIIYKIKNKNSQIRLYLKPKTKQKSNNKNR